MAGPATLYQTGDHASRPANGAGCVLYTCTDHNKVYRDDGSSWSDFIDLASGAGMTNPMTTAGDIITGGASGTPARLGLGSALQHLRVNAGATALEYADPPAGGGGTFANLGYTTAGGSWEAVTANRMYLKKVTVSADATALGIAAYVKGDATNVRQLGCAIYSDNAGTPLDLVAVGQYMAANSIFLNATGRWLWTPCVGFLAAADYWIGVQINGNYSIGYDGSGSDKYQSGGGGTWLNDTSAIILNATTNKYSIYVRTLA